MRNFCQIVGGNIFLILACLFFMVFQSGCATLTLGGREKITIVTNAQNVQIKGDIVAIEKPDNLTTVIAVSKSIKKPQIIISKEGYETQKFTFVRSKRQGIFTLSTLS